jgi:UDP-N-acetylglucosamine 2-epimerase
VLVLYGTRPEAIKMAPVIAALRARPDRFATVVCTTAQHREMVDQVQELFGLRPELDLDLMRPDQSLNELAARAFAALDPVLAETAPDWVLVQGDTTTAAVGAVAAFHRRIRVGHVEAGLRTGDLQRPFPEEANRRLIDVVADKLFAPTDRAGRNLLGEGIAPSRVVVTGNTVVDALQWIDASLPAVTPAPSVLITVHRRESFGAGIRDVFGALRELATSFPDIRWTLPLHPNPNLKPAADELLTGLPNLEVCGPLPYLELLRRLRSARLVLTDSGGIQEEAPAFGVPVLVLRDKTERPEGVDAGVAKLVGTDRGVIVREASRLLIDENARAAMARAANPYGDGLAAERIVAALAGEPVTPFIAVSAVESQP